MAVCRELTKVHEEVVRGTAAELAERFDGAPPKGEVVLVIGPATRPPPARASPRGWPSCGRSWSPGPSRGAAAAAVAELTGGSANELYRALTS